MAEIYSRPSQLNETFVLRSQIRTQQSELIESWKSRKICALNGVVMRSFVCSLNNDGLSPLDVAVLSNNRPLVKMLVSFGAREGHRCKYNGDVNFLLS